ncbi:MAG: LamG domain-containing protein [Kiritimatiellae bacterium]|nr:LamG domain-containing protein [Kiritimatiellia bacterium]
MNNGYSSHVFRYSTTTRQGGEYISSGLFQPRHIFFGEDGLLYVCSRNTDANSGIKAFDCSGATAVLKTFYKPLYNGTLYSGNGGGFLDLANGQVVIPSASSKAIIFDYVAPEDATGATITPVEVVPSDLSNAFGGMFLNGVNFICSYDKTPNVSFWNGTEKKFSRTILLQVSSLRTLANIPRADPDSQLDFLEARWSFDEPANSPLFRVTEGSKIGSYDVYPRQWVQSGSTGVSGTGLWFGENSRAEFLDSKQMISPTNDFSLFFWIGFPEPVTTGQRTLLNTIDGGANRFSIAINQDRRANKFCLFLNGGVTLYGATDIDTDGKWHHLGVVRRGDQMELWVDGAIDASGTCATNVPIAQRINWQLGQFSNSSDMPAKRFFFDEMVLYGGALTTTDIQSIYSAIAPNGAAALTVPTAAPAQPIEDLSAGSRFGSYVTHVNALEGYISSPSLCIDSDGTYWLSHDFGREWGKTDNTSVIFKSTDQGATWSRVGTSILAGATLATFGESGIPKMTGLQNGILDRPRIATSTDGATWVSQNSDIQSTGGMHAQVPVLWDGRLWFATKDGAISFVWQNGEISSFSRTGASPPSEFIGTAYESIRPGILGVTPDGQELHLFRPEKPKASWLKEAEGVLQSRIISTTQSKTFAHIPFPGGYKHFGMIHDEVSGRWYAVCTPDHPATHTANIASVNQRNTLSLYTTADLESWSFVTDIIPATDTCMTLGFNEPSLAIDGNDLVIAFGVAAPDGDTGIRYTSESNFLCVRRFANFRSLPLYRKGRTTIYHVLNSAACVLKYWYCEETGEMLNDGVFVHKDTYGGQTLKNLNGLAVGSTRVFVSGITADVPYIWEFTKAGEFVRLWTLPGRIDELALSLDERTLYATDAFSNNCLYRCDLACGTFTKIISYAENNGAINTCRALAPLADGTLLFANRTDSKVQHIDSEGNLLETVVAITGDSMPQALYYDRKTTDLYILLKNASGPLYRFQNGTLSLVARTYDPDPFSLFRCGNHLFGAYLIDGIGELTSSGRRLLVPGTASLGCAASYTNPIGTLILMR